MKKLLLSLAMLMAFAAPVAHAETNVGVVDLVKILQSSKANVSLRSQEQPKQKAVQAEFDSKEKELLAEDQALVKQKDMPDKAAFEKKVKDFRQKAANEQKAIQTKKAALDKAALNAFDDIQKAVNDAVKQVATEKKMNLVVAQAPTLYHDAALNITDEVLKRVDSALPSVSVKF